MADMIFLIRYFDGSDEMSSFQSKALEAAFSHYGWFVAILFHPLQGYILKVSPIFMRSTY